MTEGMAVNVPSIDEEIATLLPEKASYLIGNNAFSNACAEVPADATMPSTDPPLRAWSSGEGDEGGENGTVEKAESDGSGKASQIDHFLDALVPRRLWRLTAHFHLVVGDILGQFVETVKPFQIE